MAEFKNVVILGDSMSDIGNKWTWPSGELGRLFGAMRVNETGRFSDGKNWTDFLVEWSTGESLMWGNRDMTVRKSTDFRTLSGFSVLEVSPWNKPSEPKPPTDLTEYFKYMEEEKKKKPTPALPLIKYVNYSMGGCIVTRDWTIAPKFGALSYLRGQVEDYIGQRRMTASGINGATLHVIWIGLNDFVTAERPDYSAAKVKSVPPGNDFESWRVWTETHPKEVSNGVGVFPAVAEIRSLVELINSSFATAKADHHFMVIDLPSVYNAIRYIQGLGEPSKVEQAQYIDPVIRRYNAMLESLVKNWPAGENAPAADHVHLVQMSKWMDYLSNDLKTWKLSQQAQERGVPVFYDAALPGTPTTDPVSVDVRRRITTSDLGHPTEAVYSLMARYFVTKLLESGHTLGRLTAETWRQKAPHKDLPFDAPG